MTLVIAGLSGDSGKTLVALALLAAARERGVRVRAFKKGPDYIDAAWLARVSGGPAWNLDTYLMGFDEAAASFQRHAAPGGLNVIEGNRGLFDGVDARGTHSTAELAKALGAPVVLVLNAAKVTRTAAALILGCRALDPEVKIAGVVLNHVAGERHERVLREAIASACSVPVVGVVPKLEGPLLPQRHLGLVPPEEHGDAGALRARLAEAARGLDFAALMGIADVGQAFRPAAGLRPGIGRRLEKVRIACLKDSAFTFYYPDNLEALVDCGAELVAVSALDAPALPPGLDALYIGGGFPETHAGRLAANTSFLASLGEAARAGLPIYAECGGLMLLSRAILWEGRRYPMAGVLPFEVEVRPTPQGHGYSELRVDRANPFFPVGTRLKGHEFHYSRIVGELPPAACSVLRGTGCDGARDAVTIHNVWASYTHLHALGAPDWAQGLVRAARRLQVSNRICEEVLA